MKEFVESKNGKLLKLYVSGEDGIPDRLLLMPNKIVAFIEFKKRGKKAGKLQVYQMKKLREIGFDTHIIDNVHDAKKVVDMYGN